MHRHPFGIIYSSGVKFAAETFGAFWFIDLIASHQPAIRRNLKLNALRGFQVWRLHKIGDDWEADAWSDTPEGEGSILLAKQPIGWSSFPEALSPFADFWLEGDTLILKHEH